MLRRIFFLLFVIAMIIQTGCDFGDLRLTARFKDASGLKVGDRIIHERGYIGDVEKIFGTDDGRYLIELDIDKDHKKKITDRSIFYIDDDPDRPGEKAVFIEQKEVGGIPLVDGSVVAGLNSPPHLRHIFDDLTSMTREITEDLARQMSDQLKESEKEIETKLKELEEAVRSAPDSPEAKELTENLDGLVVDLEKTVERLKKLIGDDLVKAFGDSLDGFKKRLEELHKRQRPPGKGAEKNEKVRI